MAQVGEITSVQWDAARLAFLASLDDKEGLSVGKYEQIIDVLQSWEDCTPKERREKAGGNHVYWYEKFRVSAVGGKTELLMQENAPAPAEGGAEGDVVITDAMKRCSHQDRMFDDIKQIHIESELVPTPATRAAPGNAGTVECHACLQSAPCRRQFQQGQ